MTQTTGRLFAILWIWLATAAWPAFAGAAPPRAPAPPTVEARAREGRARVAQALLRYADGRRGTAQDRRLANALDRVPRARKAAQRLAKGLRAAPNRAKQRAFGPHASTLTAAPAAGGSAVFAQPVLTPVTPGLVHWLPAEAVAVPQQMELTLAGLHSNAAADGSDDTDELVVVANLYRSTASGAKLAASLNSGGAVRIAEGKTKALADGMTLHNLHERLLATGVAHAGTSAQQAQDDLAMAFALAFELAQGVADGPDLLTALANAIAYTEGVLALAKPGASPSLHTVALSPGELEGLYSAPAADAGGVSHKLSLPHALGQGRYDVLVDVPSKPVPTPAIRVLTQRVRSMDVDLPADAHMTLRVTINGETHSQPLVVGKSDVTLNLDVRRKVAGNDPVELRFALRWDGIKPEWKSWTKKKKKKKFVGGKWVSWGLPYEAKYYCGNPPAPIEEALQDNDYEDVGPCPIPGGTLAVQDGTLTYDPKTGTLAFTGSGLSKVGGAYHLGGSGDERGFVRFTVSGG